MNNPSETTEVAPVEEADGIRIDSGSVLKLCAYELGGGLDSYQLAHAKLLAGIDTADLGEVRIIVVDDIGGRLASEALRLLAEQNIPAIIEPRGENFVIVDELHMRVPMEDLVSMYPGNHEDMIVAARKVHLDRDDGRKAWQSPYENISGKRSGKHSRAGHNNLKRMLPRRGGR